MTETSTGRPLGSTWKNGNFRLDYNCWWDTKNAEFKFGDKTFAEVFSGFSALVHLPGQLRRKALGAAQKLTPYEPVACG